MQRILFFDGYCNLCNRSVDFLIRHDRHKHLVFAPLQGKTAAELLPEALRAQVDTVVFYDDGALYTQSTAALKVAKLLGFPWSLARVFFFFPPKWRDGCYRYIANRRSKWFGERSTCRMPSPEERARFLD